MTRVSQSYWRIVVSVSNCDEPLIDWLQNMWAGAVLKGISKGPTRRIQHRWTVVGNDARRVLAECAPYLVVKPHRAAWALEVLSIQANHRKGTSYDQSTWDRLEEIRGLFDTDRSRSWSARGRDYEKETAAWRAE